MKPSAIIHMLIWGIATGTIAGALLTLLIITGSIDPNIPAFRVLLNLGTLLLISTGASLGAAAGLLIGMLNGGMLSIMTRFLPKFRTQQTQMRLYILLMPIFLILSVIASLGVFALFDRLIGIGNWFWTVLPIIAGLISLYPMHRYLTRLRRWYMIQPDNLARQTVITHNRLTDMDNNQQNDDTVETSSQVLLSEN